ncbi:hypothetical protein AZE42_07853 [Rhizopogon vesiculosus]|uniref:Uncharacterized protein n=1 Tax=Rhizopogon vesiculosus TaxID=180088 RepID=A0A1J8QYK8_9AGAM|nr:hypothetical protein AZE42_07853 [Rhizopogon vesiculosus]
MQPACGAAEVILEPTMTLKGHMDFVSSISYCPDRKRMVSGSYNKTVRQWDLQTGKEIEKSRDVHEHGVGMVAVSRDGQRVITNEDVHDGGEPKDTREL